MHLSPIINFFENSVSKMFFLNPLAITFLTCLHYLFYQSTGGYDLDTVPVRDMSPRSPRHGTPDSGWDDDDDLDLGLGN